MLPQSWSCIFATSKKYSQHFFHMSSKFYTQHPIMTTELHLFLFYSKCKDVKTKNWIHVTFYYYRDSNNCISSISVWSKQLPCGKTIWCEYDQHAGCWGEIALLITRHSWYSSFFLESSLGFFFLKNRGILSFLNLLLFVCIQNKCCSVETGEERPPVAWSQTCNITVSFFIEGHFNSLHFNLSVTRKYTGTIILMPSFHVQINVTVIEILEVSLQWNMNKQGGCGRASDYRKFDCVSMNSAHLPKSKDVIFRR